jgi:hypothetical protein
VIIWHFLADPNTRFHDLGDDHYDRHVTLTPRNATTSANLKHSATESPSNPPPDTRTCQTESIFGLVAQSGGRGPSGCERGQRAARAVAAVASDWVGAPLRCA